MLGIQDGLVKIDQNMGGIQDGHDRLGPYIFVPMLAGVQEDPVEIGFQVPAILPGGFWVSNEHCDFSAILQFAAAQ